MTMKVLILRPVKVGREIVSSGVIEIAADVAKELIAIKAVKPAADGDHAEKPVAAAKPTAPKKA